MTSADFAAKRITRTYGQTMNASPEQVFPLICPVREAEWLDGWRYRMIYSKSGLVEEGAVFSTPSEGEQDTVWIITRHDPARRVAEFTRFTAAGNAFIDGFTESSFLAAVTFWERSMNHWLKTGERLGRG